MFLHNTVLSNMLLRLSPPCLRTYMNEITEITGRNLTNIEKGSLHSCSESLGEFVGYALER